MERPLYALLRLPLIAGTAWAITITMTPPNAAPLPEHRVERLATERYLLPGFTSWVPTLGKVRVAIHRSSLNIFWIFFLCESSAIIGAQFRTFQGCLPFVTPVSLAASTMALAGGLIRRSCYLHLSKLFTFDLAILPDHRLVTSGPYAVVRHPSYSGALLSAAGAVIMFLGSRGSWLIECSGLISDNVKLWFGPGLNSLSTFAAIFGSVTSLGLVFMLPRAQKEDEMMKRQFGKEWEDWSRLVRWRLVPGVY
ncbi:hypothetical protein Moror_6969 [Moniliophthora roreri MCA 2997]|uniref:Protein-S-isoprenylcysteine O-methyltransferase n=2 Tax=Moniliophthora roreri TaxID=221103 RepID=V2XUC5_MONRO|nr:hypothetical protein Moror_6969 [Moniliophthora roreri MCA 2997]KAI3619700.1 hypothetical protein WG66_002897 [Moniliophthora roreri]